jgi:hypothetical protein
VGLVKKDRHLAYVWASKRQVGYCAQVYGKSPVDWSKLGWTGNNYVLGNLKRKFKHNIFTTNLFFKQNKKAYQPWKLI